MKRGERVGVWIIGALGDVATTTVLGARAIARGLADTTGLVTARPPFEALELPPPAALVFGGHDVRDGNPLEAAQRLARLGVVPIDLVTHPDLIADLSAYAARVRPGVVFGAGEVVQKLESKAARGRRDFRASERLDRVVVVALASTEPVADAPPGLETLADARAALSGDVELPASVVYALAAAAEGCPYVNFTPSLGSAPAGVAALFADAGLPHMGCDGKTGQTLLRTALAPMFLARNFNVLSWAGFNILGNRDGEVLDEPGANAAKTQGKDSVLGAILGEQLGTSLTRIDYVPSLEDWKTAWDHVHFEGFLGTRMALELTWRGADSALAAPLVLDLARLIALAARQGRSGLQTGLACFFKTPQGVSEYSFPAQTAMLEAYAAELRAGQPARA